MAPSVCLTAAATPELPLAPCPTGHSTALSEPTLSDHSELALDSQEVNTAVVPDSSERCTIVICVDGSFTPLLSAAISGSFHVLTLPRKTSAVVLPSSLRPLGTPFALYSSATAPTAVGNSM